MAFIQPIIERAASRRKPTIRPQSELLCHWAEHIPPDQRALILAVHLHGHTFRQLAALVGQRPRTVGRHVRQIARRMLDPAFTFVLTNHRTWPEPLATIAVAIWIEGASLRAVARRLGLPYYTARRHQDTLRGMIAAAEAVDGPRAIRPHGLPGRQPAEEA